MTVMTTLNDVCWGCLSKIPVGPAIEELLARIDETEPCDTCKTRMDNPNVAFQTDQDRADVCRAFLESAPRTFAALINERGGLDPGVIAMVNHFIANEFDGVFSQETLMTAVRVMLGPTLVRLARREKVSNARAAQKAVVEFKQMHCRLFQADYDKQNGVNDVHDDIHDDVHDATEFTKTRLEKN